MLFLTLLNLCGRRK